MPLLDFFDSPVVFVGEHLFGPATRLHARGMPLGLRTIGSRDRPGAMRLRIDRGERWTFEPNAGGWTCRRGRSAKPVATTPACDVYQLNRRRRQLSMPCSAIIAISSTTIFKRTATPTPTSALPNQSSPAAMRVGRATFPTSFSLKSDPEAFRSFDQKVERKSQAGRDED